MNYQDMLANMNVDKLVEPVRRYNALVVDNAGKLLEIQLESARSYADLGIKQLRDVTEISDLKTFQAYWSNQAEVAKTVAERAQQDARKVAEIGQGFTAELQNLVQENITALAGQGKSVPKAKPASSTASAGGQSAARKSA